MDYEKAFTEKVAEYIRKGYVINVHSMNGFQSELAKVDMHKGRKFVRIAVYRRYPEGFMLKVGKTKLPEWYEERYPTIWTVDLEDVEIVHFRREVG